MSSTCEVRVEGVVGLAMLQHLHWSHRVVPEHTVLRVAADPADLPDLLQALTDAGLTIESVRPIDPSPSTPSLNGGASRDPDPAPGAPRPLVG